MKPKTLHLITAVAIAGLDHTRLCPADRAEFYDGLGAILAPPMSEAARYAATCIRESERAERDFLAAIESRKGNPAR